MSKIEYYCIIKLHDITIENINAHIKKFETLDFAYNFPDTDVVIVKEYLGGRTDSTGFYYPSIYGYKVYCINEQPYYLGYKNNKVSEYILETVRSGYYYDEGRSDVPIIDRNGILQKVKLSASFNKEGNFILELIKYLINFENAFSSDWNVYDLKKELDETKNGFGYQIEELKENISGLKEKLKQERIKNKNLRIKIKQNSLQK